MEFYFDFQVRCSISASVFVASWKTHHISSQRGRKVISRKEAADGGDEVAEGIFGYSCLLYDSQPHPTQQCSEVSFVTVPVSGKSGLSNFGTTVDFSSDGILN